jgi:hypothetical protein
MLLSKTVSNTPPGTKRAGQVNLRYTKMDINRHVRHDDDKDKTGRENNPAKVSSYIESDRPVENCH